MRILITGSSGFIGTPLCRELYKLGNEICCIDIAPPSKILPGAIYSTCDICQELELTKVFNKFKPDHLIHLAARTDLDNSAQISDYSTNTKGVSNILKAVSKTSSLKRCIYTSSQLVHKVGYIQKHKQDYCPTTAYGKSKVITEETYRKLPSS